jgi:hypothetical protein
MSTGFSNFRFQGPMPSFQFRKMRFYGHIGLLSQVDGQAAKFEGERPNRSVPLLHAVKGVLGYREAVRRQFPRSVAVSTQLHHLVTAV